MYCHLFMVHSVRAIHTIAIIRYTRTIKMLYFHNSFQYIYMHKSATYAAKNFQLLGASPQTP